MGAGASVGCGEGFPVGACDGRAVGCGVGCDVGSGEGV